MAKLHATIDRIEAQQAVCITDDGQEIVVPTSVLPDGAVAGSVVTISINSEIEETTERELRAKEILNQILQKKS